MLKLQSIFIRRPYKMGLLADRKPGWLLLVIFMCLNSACNTSVQSEKAPAQQKRGVAENQEVTSLLEKNTCNTCHKQEEKFVGPSYKDIAARKYSNERIVDLVYNPEPSNWPDYPSPMVPMKHIPKEDLLVIANWINTLN